MYNNLTKERKNGIIYTNVNKRGFMSYDEPIYNIGAVVRMTEIPAATLRIWERRYGFPEPTRTEGKHRLYSEHEVHRLQWIKAKTGGGMQIRQAIQALRAEEAASAARAELLPETSMPSLPTAAKDAHLEPVQEQLLTNLLAHNTAQANLIINDALALSPPENLILNVIGPTLNTIGLGWQAGEIDIGTEHLATNYLRQRLMMWLRTGPPAYDVRPTVLACAPGEWHDGSLMIFGALLRRRRWPVTFLGQSLPLPDLAKLVRQTHPLAVVLVAMLEAPAQALIPWPTWLPEAAETGRPAVAYGGLAFNEHPELRDKVPGVFLGTSFQEGVERLEGILQRESSVERSKGA